jgi:hypothetical protein
MATIAISVTRAMVDCGIQASAARQISRDGRSNQSIE